MDRKERVIRIYDIVEGSVAVSSEDGVHVFRAIDEAISQDEIAVLNFESIDLITSTFLNAAIGQLYSKYKSDQLRMQLRLLNMDEDDKKLLKLVVDRAKEYFRDRKEMEQTIKNALEDEE